MPKAALDDIENALDKPVPSVRDTLTAALKEQREDDGDDDDKVVKSKEVEGEIEDDDPLSDGIDDGGEKEPAKKKAKAAEPDTEAEEIDETEKTEEVSEEDKEETPKLKKTKVAAPENWKDTADWDKTPASVRQKIIKREEEVSAGFKEYGQKARAFDEYEQFVGPRRQSMAKIGVTPAQVIGRALDWMDALGHPDPKTKSQAFKVLAGNFGIDLASLAPVNANGGESNRGGGSGDELSDTAKQYIGGLQSEIAALKQQIGGVTSHLETQQDRAAAEYLDNWSKDKPHFPKVQNLVATYMQSGNGSIDLDTAYNMAIAANPEVKELIRLEGLEKAKLDAAKQAKDAAKKKQALITKARGANSSLKPGSPASFSTKGLKNGASVRDTIKHSLKQISSESA